MASLEGRLGKSSLHWHIEIQSTLTGVHQPWSPSDRNDGDKQHMPNIYIMQILMQIHYFGGFLLTLCLCLFFQNEN